MKKFALLSISFLLMHLINFAQCAMCTKTAQGLDRESQSSVNSAIIYLAVIPFSIVVGLGIYFFKQSRNNN